MVRFNEKSYFFLGGGAPFMPPYLSEKGTLAHTQACQYLFSCAQLQFVLNSESMCFKCNPGCWFDNLDLQNINHTFSKICLATEIFKNKTQKFPTDFLERPKMRLLKVYVARFFQNKNRQRWDLKMKTTDSDGNIIFDDFVTQVKWEYFSNTKAK